MWTSITVAMCSTSPPQSDGQASLFFPIPPSASIATGRRSRPVGQGGQYYPPATSENLRFFDNNCQTWRFFYATLPEMAYHHQQSH